MNKSHLARSLEMHLLQYLLQGFAHEQGRPDRNDWIDITTVLVPGADTANQWNINGAIVDTGSDYDYATVMHYSSGAAIPGGYQVFFNTLNPLPVCLTNAGLDIGQRADASARDIRQLRLLYNCEDGFQSDPLLQEDPQCRTDCR